jgi:non-structural maintenance of chromosomes element 1
LSPPLQIEITSPQTRLQTTRTSHAPTTTTARMSDDGSPASDYDTTHRAFLQALLSRQTITLTDARPLLAAIQTTHNPHRPTLANDISQEDLDNYVHALNAQISPFDLEIRNSLHQVTKERIYALVNTTSDALTQMSTVHAADEIAFVKRVLDAMFETNNTGRAEVMAITSMQALKLAKPPVSEEGRRDSGTQHQNSASADAGLTMRDAEKVLDSMVEEGWFELSQRGYYSLTPRALMELRGWLTETYNEPNDEEDEEEEEQRIKFCQACREIVTVGQRCPDLECSARVHNHCVRTLFRAHGGREECPQCKTAWRDPPAVGEKAARTTRESSGANRRRTTGGRSEASMGMGMDGAADQSAGSGAEDG